MKIIISPAKKMRDDSDTLPATALPCFVREAAQLADTMRAMAPAALQKLWQCSDKLTTQNLARLEHLDPYRAQTPALLAYEGLQYQYMAPEVLEDAALAYLDAHLRILSGFYGLLRPFDAVTSYRLEMQAKVSVGGARDLYAFWGRKLYDALDAQDGVILNLASVEYARAIQPYLSPSDRFVTVRFGELVKGRFKQKGTFAKMARGEMVRFMAVRQISDVMQLCAFDALGLHYDARLSDARTLTFVKENEEKV